MRSLFSIPVFDKEAGFVAASSAAIPNATKLQPGVYLVLKSNIATNAGAFDLYIVESNGDIFRIEQPSGKKEKATNEEEIEIALSRPQETTVSKDKKQQFIVKQLFSGEIDQEKMKTITAVHNCFGGHDFGTCGWTTLASDIALLAYKLNSKSVKIDENFLTITIPGFEGEIKLKTGSDNDFENRKNLAAWLEKNKELLEKLSPALKTGGDPENFFKEIQRISQLKEIKGISDYLTYQIFGVVDKDLTLEKIIKAKVEIEQQKLEKQSQEERDKFRRELEEKYKNNNFDIKINWENITIEDVAILALLSAFLAVISGPGALVIPVVIAAFRAISIEKGLNLEGKVDFSAPTLDPKPSSSDSKAQQLVDQKTAVLTAAGAA